MRLANLAYSAGMADPPIKPLDLADLRTAHSVLSDVFADDPEPIPEWETGDIPLLETCCGCSEVEAFGRQKYPDLLSKAGKLFYSGVKLHCFPNGNKRFGLVVMLMFVVQNNKHLDAPPGSLSDIAKYIAESDPLVPEGHHEKIAAEVTDRLAEMIRNGPYPSR
jgi:prophage maintenance system killer protein